MSTMAPLALTAWTLFSYLGVVSTWQAVVVTNEVFARMGESRELPCTYSTTPEKGFTLEWRFAGLGTPAIQAQRVMYFNGNVYWGKSWGNQAELVQNPPTKGTASLRILNVQPSNAGIYICEVTNPVDWESSGQGLINFTVLVPPSTPQCKLNGNPYAGNDVTLTCKASYGIPAPIYSWSREKNAPPLSPDNLVEDQKGGSLILRNLSSSFSGSYTCMASNELGSAMCAVALRVTYINNALIIGSAVMAAFIILLLLAAVLAYFLCKKKPKPTHEKQEQRETQKNRAAHPEDHLLDNAEEPPEASRSFSHHRRMGPSKPSILV